MKFSSRFRNFQIVENFHIFFWLIKDISWCLEFRLLGVAMIIPTILVTFIMMNRTRLRPDFYVNLSVLFWISANSYWMCAEFFGFVEHKDLAVIPFILGFLSFFVYLFKLNRADTNT